jgi:hypothetical protein
VAVGKAAGVAVELLVLTRGLLLLVRSWRLPQPLRLPQRTAAAKPAAALRGRRNGDLSHRNRSDSGEEEIALGVES